MSDSGRGERLEMGTIFKSRYEITGFLGEGGFASVYKARDVEIGREVAIKILHILATVMDPTSHTSIIERFRQEARTAAQIKHPAVMTIFDVGMTDDNHPYIIMDFLNGYDLEHELETHGPMELSRALPLFCRCLEALAEAHRLGIVHKDLKPSNLFLTDPRTPQESISIVDFGIARVTEDNDARLTSAGQILGTPRYMAPEYIDSQTVSPATDVYQMGLILIEMLTGVPVVKQETLISCIMVHANGVEVPDSLRSTPLGPILAKATNRDPDGRIPTCEAFLDMLMGTDFTAMGLPNAAMAISRMTTRLPPVVAPPTTPPPATPDKKARKPQTTPGPSNTYEPEPPTGGGGAGKIIGGVIGLLVVVGLVVGGLFAAGIIGGGGEPDKPPVSKGGDDNKGGDDSNKGGDDNNKGGDDNNKGGDDKDVARAVKKGKEHIEAQEWEEASAALKPAVEAGDDEGKKLDKQARAEQSNREAYADAIKMMVEGKVDEGNKKLKGLPEDSWYAKRDKEARKEAIGSLIEKMDAAEKAKKGEDFGEALAIATKIDPADKRLEKYKNKGPQSGAMAEIPKGVFHRGIDKDAVKDAMEICKVARAQGERCSPNLFAAEQPRSLISMDAYSIDVLEVSNKDYLQCVEKGKCSRARYSSTCGNEDPSILNDDHPVVCVTQADAEAYCKWAGKRLPTEAEWEYAAGGKDGVVFPWGNEWNSKFSNWGDADGSLDGHKFTSPVGAAKKDKSPFGVMDMGGNVSEWTVDGFDPKFYKSQADLPLNRNPVNKEAKKGHAIRGGNWLAGAYRARTTARESLKPDGFDASTGFRCVK